MKNSVYASALVLLPVLTPSVFAQRAKAPVRLQFGWGTTHQDLAKVAKDSEILKESQNEDLDVCFVYDEFWIILPFWTSSGSFALHRAVEPPEEPDGFLVLEDQDKHNVAKLLGVPEASITTPFFYRVPFGWIVVVATGVAVRLFSGPKPPKRFARLWSDHRYRTAVANMLGLEGQSLPDQFDQITVPGAPSDPDARLEQEVQKLREYGASPGKSRRDLEFMLSYLADNGKIRVEQGASPPDDDNAESDSAAQG